MHVLDRYHIAAKLNKAVDECRADEARRMKARGLAGAQAQPLVPAEAAGEFDGPARDQAA